MFTVYVLQSTVASKAYVGFTNNIERRIAEHNAGKHSYTKRYMPWILKYTEQFDNLREARERERYFKSGAGRKYLKTRIFSK